jgi:signal peptidase I
MADERSVWREYAEALLIAAIFLRFTNVFVVQTFYIPSGSMEKTLLIGDHLFVNRFIYGPTATEWERKLLPVRDLRRGDIVVFRSKEAYDVESSVDVVKRCIAVGGDTISLASYVVSVNGHRVDDHLYTNYEVPEGRSGEAGLNERPDYGPAEVEPGHCFCMGDHRNNSYDSRWWGPLPRKLVKGRALFIYWSYGGKTSDGNWHGFGAKVWELVETLFTFPTRTRWERTFQLIR